MPKHGNLQKVKENSIKNPENFKKDIYISTDKEGFNKNPSEQENYPGVQKHEPNSDAPTTTEKDIAET